MRRLLCHAFALSLHTACVMPGSDSLRPRVNKAPRVGSSTFATVDESRLGSGLACSRLDPSGSLARGGPLELVVESSGVRIDDHQVIPLQAGVVPKEIVKNGVILPLYDTLLIKSENHINGVESYPCLPPFTGTVLIDIDAALSTDLLVRLLYTAAMARYDDPWLRVDADADFVLTPWANATPVATSSSSDQVEWCIHRWQIDWSTTLPTTVQRLGESAKSVALHNGDPDHNSILDLVSQPDWAVLEVSVEPRSSEPIGPLVELFSDFYATHGGRGKIALGRSCPTPVSDSSTNGGPFISAVPMPLVGLCGECLFASNLPYCVGLDGANHGWIGDPCHR